jgi:hypothetical protein
MWIPGQGGSSGDIGFFVHEQHEKHKKWQFMPVGEASPFGQYGHFHQTKAYMRHLLLFFLLLLLASCAAYTRHQLDRHYGVADPARFGPPISKSFKVSYRRDVKPITDSRCTVCHGCFDAPCQLQMGSYEGITRGASKEKIYDEFRLLMMAPTRLFTDAQDNPQWRQKGFVPVLNERHADPVADLEASVMANLLQLKKHHVFPTSGVLPAGRYDFELYREQICPALEEFPDYAKEFKKALNTTRHKSMP